MSFASRLRALVAPETRSAFPLMTIDDYAQMLSFSNYQYTLNQTLVGDREEIDANFSGLVQGAYRANGIVFACLLTRFLLFSQARFQFQQMRGGQPGDLFGTPDLSILERPEPGKTTGDLLSRAITDADLAGNWFGARRPGRIKRMRPDWTVIILGSPNRDSDIVAGDIDAEVAGYVYVPGGPYSGNDPITFSRDEVAHFAPIPDPLASYRGMSWLTPVIRETMADQAATTHKLKYFEHAATPNMVVKFDPSLTIAKAREWIETFEQEHAGVMNAYRTAYMGGGADMTAVGNNLQQIDFRAVQGAGEVRIVNASGIHPTIVGVSEGLQGSSLNSGNFGAARRLTADKALRPLWQNIAGSLETIVPPPPGSRLWYDERHIPFLAEDVKDAADVQSVQAAAIAVLTTNGYEAKSVIDAITSDDFRRLVHTGLFSVQLQPPRPEAPPEPPQLPAGRSIAGLLGAGDEIRCKGVQPDGRTCNRLLAERATAPYRLTCSRCKTVAEADDPLALMVSHESRVLTRP